MEIQIVESAVGFTVMCGPYESRAEAERVASLLRFELPAERRGVLPRDTLDDIGE